MIRLTVIANVIFEAAQETQLAHPSCCREHANRPWPRHYRQHACDGAITGDSNTSRTHEPIIVFQILEAAPMLRAADALGDQMIVARRRIRTSLYSY